MNSTAALIDPSITMRELLEEFPGAQRALFRKYHIGGCSSCGFNPDETLAGVCQRNDLLDVEEVIEYIVASESAERAMQIEPRELADRISRGGQVYLLDIRTREEYDAVKIDNAQLFRELMQSFRATVARIFSYLIMGRAVWSSRLFPGTRIRKREKPAWRHRCLER
jgi:rhodanese-related sulfurtransferase